MSKRRQKLSRFDVAALDHQRQSFREKFGREPRPDDPFLCNVIVLEPKATPLQQMKDEMVGGMLKAKIRRELIFAYIRTNLIVTKSSRRNLTSKKLKEWDDSIEEFLQTKLY
jgi:hypothetical protein